MKLTNKYDLPEFIARAARNDKYTNGGAWRSVTDLINSPRVSMLRRMHWDDLEEDLSDKIWALLGTATHSLMEEANKEDTVEERLFAEVEGRVISGGIDIQRLSVQPDGKTHVRIMDWKVCAAYSVMKEKPEWANQLNTYAHLVERNKPDHVVTDLTIVAIIRDYSRRKAQYERDYPRSPIVAIPITLWSPEEREAYVVDRVRKHIAAETSLPDCTNEDKWCRPTYQLWRKEGGSRAIRNFDRKEEAEAALTDSFEIRVKWGEPVRCRDNWCRVRDWCDQYKREKGNG